ncbi:hypothetical protein [Anaerocolumna xylanovorans]|uniref:Uncharacterized protein n=1 Tax=Anaerocolumna xylanovorans DSM 12503 TaxID=1121345 RepID=A0A1M7Y8Y3_9FIRM|nr:hypothetical protein [Anaerocolumna xylanovorans]SHO49093.1 hypothetical protein SAMN02745217_02122 [Anaerocolumna xylanovorans DSM 12503]
MDEKQILMNEELKEEEVNIYEKDCGSAQTHCITDCFPFHTALINGNR